MEPSDLPLVNPIAATIETMFGETMQELAAFQSRFAAADEVALQQAVDDAVAASLAAAEEAAAAAAAANANASGGAAGAKGAKGGGKGPSKSGKPGGGSAKEQAAEEQQQQQRLEAERARIEAQVRAAPQKLDPFRKRAAAIATEDQTFFAAAQPHCEFYRQRLEHLSTKPSDAYMIEDILMEWALNVPPETHPGCIDTAQLARDHTARLTTEFGFAVPRGLHSVGKGAAEQPAAATMLQMLSTHSAAGRDVAKEFVCKKVPAPPSAAAPEAAADATRGSAAEHQGAQTPAAESRCSPRQGKRALRRALDKSVVSGASSSCQSQLPMSVLERAQQSTPTLESSHEQISFDGCLPGHRYEALVTLWNRDSHLRLVKFSPSPSPQLLSVHPASPGYSAEKPLAPGCSVSFRIEYAPTDAARVELTLQVGHTRDSNRMSAEENKKAQWAFLDLPVVCSALEPRPVLLNDARSALREDVEIDPTFVFATTTISVPVMNAGAAADFALSIAPPFAVTPTQLTLAHGAVAELSVTFAPVDCEGRQEVEAQLSIVASLCGSDGTFESTFLFRSQAVVPSVWLEGVGTATLESFDTNTRSVPTPPLLIIDDACAAFTSQKTLCVRNDSPLPVAFEWKSLQSVPCGLQIFPPDGVLAPERSTVFSVEVTPSSDASIQCLLFLHLLGLPPVPPGRDVPFLSRDKPLPLLHNGSAADPFALFGTPSKKMDVEPVADGPVFCSAVRLVADPTGLDAHVAPVEITNAVPVLIHQANYREFTIVNTCNRDLEFWVDPPRGEDHPDAQLDEEALKRRAKRHKRLRELRGPSYEPPQSHERDGVELCVSPQRGVVRGNGVVTVGLTFTLNRPGAHEVDIECFFPLLAEPKRRQQLLTLHAVARGPEVTASTDLIDFGIIPLHDEAEARLTLSNINPIPLVFRCRDPIIDGPVSIESARYVFLPESGPLKPGQSVDVTVYRRGDAVGDVRESLLVEVVDGETLPVAVRACIQKPAAYVTPNVVDCGEVDRGIATYYNVALANLSAIDLAFELVVVDAPEDVAIAMSRPSGILAAGEREFAVSLEVIFSGTVPGRALLALHSPQLEAPVPFEVTCSRINQLAISLDVSAADRSAAETTSAPQELHKFPLPTGCFVGDLLANLVSAVLGDPIKPYCGPLVLDGLVIPDDEPFCKSSAILTIRNHSGCNTKFAVMASRFAPFLPSHHQAFDGTAATSAVDGAATVTTNASATQKRVTAVGGSVVRTPVAPMERTLLGFTGGRSAGASLTTRSRSEGRGKTHAARTNLATTAKHSGDGKPKEEKKIVLSTFNPSFTCKALDGREEAARSYAAQLQRTQNMLLDGRGCAVEVENGTGDLGGHSGKQVGLHFFSNLPGIYDEKLQFQCDGLPSVALDVHMSVRGRVIVLDPNTSGVSVDAASRQARLVLPPIVGGMTTIKRRIRVTSRCPRDLLLHACVVEKEQACQAWLTCLGQEEKKEEGPLRLTLQRRSDDVAATATSLVQQWGVVAPTSRLLPALESMELEFEYAPPPGSKGTWTGKLTIAAMLADTPFNDRFLVDEFYAANAARYPSSRTVAMGTIAGSQAVDRCTMRGVSKIVVKSPLIDRPGVVKDSAIVLADDIEQRMARLGKPSGGAAADDSGDEDASGEARKGHAHDLEYEQRMRQLRERLKREEEERCELQQFLRERRALRQTEFAAQVMPTELAIVATNVEPILVTDPETMLRFPMCRVGGQCDRTVTLTNAGVTPFDFRLECADPFRITRAGLVLDELDVAGPASDGIGVEGASLSASKSKVRSSSASLAAGLSARNAGNALGSLRSAHPHSDPAATLFRLNPRQILSVTVELALHAAEAKQHVSGALSINFTNRSQQSLPLLATVHVPTLTCEPEVTWFRPCLVLENGRPQPQYERTVKLVNYSICDAPFEIVHAPAGRPVSRGTEALSRLQKAQQTLQVTPLQQHALVLDDPTRFVLSATRGVVPAASAGGCPGSVDVRVQFHESATTTFESRFDVHVAGGAGSGFIVRGESKETEL